VQIIKREEFIEEGRAFFIKSHFNFKAFICLCEVFGGERGFPKGKNNLSKVLKYKTINF
jgi:hypothetical protein